MASNHRPTYRGIIQGAYLIPFLLAYAPYAGAQTDDKAICRKRCDDTPVGQSLSGQALNEGSQEALALFACYGGCELGRYADRATLHWNVDLAVAKECKGVERVYHMPCTDAQNVWAMQSSQCGAVPATFHGHPLPAKDPEQVIGFNTFAWVKVQIPEDSCKMDWADARAHDKGCSGTSHVFHVRCERPDGSWTDECTGMARREFRGSTMTADPVRLEDKAWTQVAVQDATCGVGWADDRAQDKGCRGTARIYHVRCERPDGSWSTDCSDMPSRMFHGLPMQQDPARLADRAWTEVAIPDATCR